MSIKRILFCTGQGIGNVIQCIPVIRTLKEVLGYKIDFWHMYGSYILPKLIPYVDGWFVGNDIYNVDVGVYDGKVCTGWIKHHTGKSKQFAPYINKIKTLAETIKPLFMTRSEVDVFMDIARDLGVKEQDLIWHGECNYNESEDKYDVAIHDGYNKRGVLDWSIKSYPYYKEVATLLKEKGFSVCSLGTPEEYILGTEDKTGMPLLDTIGVVANSKVFLSNDSGLYHCANALGVKNVVIFTATSIKKNYDKRFHKYSEGISRNDLRCMPCQGNHGWKVCKTWDCRNINPYMVADIVGRKLNGHSV